MKKFIVSKRSIMAVEVKIISALEDPSIMWNLKSGEYKAQVILPKALYISIKKNIDGKEESQMVPPIYYSHSFYDSIEDALEVCKKNIVSEFEFALRKHGKNYTQQDIATAIKDIEIIDFTS